MAHLIRSARSMNLQRFSLPGWGLAALLSIVHLAAGPSGAQTAGAHIDQLTRPGSGNDSVARTQLRKLTHDSFRPGAEGERAAQETALLKGLSEKPDWEVKSLLMEELGLAGKGPAVAPVSAYLSDANLCDFAAQSLLSIRSTENAPAVAAAIREALGKTGAPGAAAGKCRLSLMQAAGVLRDTAAAAVDILLAEAASADKATRLVAWRALANIGDLKAKAALETARQSANLFEQSQGVSLSLLFALRLGERGRKDQGLAVAQAVKSAAKTDETHVVLYANFTLDSLGRMPVSLRDAGAARMPGPLAAEGAMLRFETDGAFRLRIMDMSGRVRRELRGREPGAHSLTLEGLRAGVYTLIWEDEAGAVTRPLVRF